MRYEKIKQLIDLFENFENETGSDDFTSFGNWLQHRESGVAVVLDEPERGCSPVEGAIMMEVGRLTNLVKIYIRKATSETPLAGWNDMAAIIVLYDSPAGSLRKTELLQTALIEMSPGMEVLRRLKREGVIREFPDPDDKRAKRVRLTRAGKRLYKEIEKDLCKVGKVVVGNLSLEEKQRLHLILEKLGHFHYSIWDEDAEATLDQILEQYIQVKRGNA
ncbi:MAG: MarR family transcriptional regulator [Bacteroidota bacterium]